MHRAGEGGPDCPSTGSPTVHGGWAPAVWGWTASLGPGACRTINSQPIISPQPVTEPSQLNHGFQPDTAPTINAPSRRGCAGSTTASGRSLKLQIPALTVCARWCQHHRGRRGPRGSAAARRTEPARPAGRPPTAPSQDPAAFLYHHDGHKSVRSSQATSRGPAAVTPSVTAAPQVFWKAKGESRDKGRLGKGKCAHGGNFQHHHPQQGCGKGGQCPHSGQQ